MCEVHRDWIESQVMLGRNATSIYTVLMAVETDTDLSRGICPCRLVLEISGSLEPLAERRDQFARRLDIRRSQALGQSVNPRCLKGHSSVERFLALLRKNHQLRAPVMGIGLEFDQVIGGEIVDDTLHVLAIAPPCHVRAMPPAAGARPQ